MRRRFITTLSRRTEEGCISRLTVDGSKIKSRYRLKPSVGHVVGMVFDKSVSTSSTLYVVQSDCIYSFDVCRMVYSQSERRVCMLLDENSAYLGMYWLQLVEYDSPREMIASPPAPQQ